MVMQIKHLVCVRRLTFNVNIVNPYLSNLQLYEYEQRKNRPQAPDKRKKIPKKQSI